MRSISGGSYSALNCEHGGDSLDGPSVVYRSTTRPSVDGGRVFMKSTERINVVDSVKRIFRGAANNSSISSAPILKSSQSVTILPHVHEDHSMIPPAHSSSGASNFEKATRR